MIGIIFAFIALFSWGIGDFLIQRSARKFGDAIAIFFVTSFASVILLPFVWKEFLSLFNPLQSTTLLILLAATAVILAASIAAFEALRVGKISIIEPVYAFEIIVTVILGYTIIQESLSFFQILLIVFLTAGIFLISVKSFAHLRNIKWEKGIFYAIIATITMGAANFFFGLGSRESSPLLVNWFTSLVLALVFFLYILMSGRWSALKNDWKKYKGLILGVSIADNLAWVSFSYSTLYIPIGIATGISESYIALAAYLGLRYNKEKLKTHQWWGFAITVAGAILLSFTLNS